MINVFAPYSIFQLWNVCIEMAPYDQTPFGVLKRTLFVVFVYVINLFSGLFKKKPSKLIDIIIADYSNWVPLIKSFIIEFSIVVSCELLSIKCYYATDKSSSSTRRRKKPFEKSFFHKFQLMALTDTVSQVDTYITHIKHHPCVYDNRNEWWKAES